MNDSKRVLILARDLYDHLENNPLALKDTLRAIEIARWWAWSEHPERDRPIGVSPSPLMFPVSREWIQCLETGEHEGGDGG
jgi:hypothetical protein